MCMMPGGGGGHGPGHGHGHGCCTPGGRHGYHGFYCGGGMPPNWFSGWGWRRFLSPAEELEWLERYLADLKGEVAGVEARLRELKGK